MQLGVRNQTSISYKGDLISCLLNLILALCCAYVFPTRILVLWRRSLAFPLTPPPSLPMVVKPSTTFVTPAPFVLAIWRAVCFRKTSYLFKILQGETRARQQQSCWLPLSGFDSETAQVNCLNCHGASFTALNLGFSCLCLLNGQDLFLASRHFSAAGTQ